MKFADLRLIEPLLQTVADKGYEVATPIQAQTIPFTLDGRDVLGCAQTGTGKTAAFALPILQKLHSEKPAFAQGKRKLPRALILAPTRELAQQIAESFQTYGKRLNINGTVIYGGVGQGPQVNSLRMGVDVVVATPGRLLDLVNQRCCDLSAVEMFVLDEADRMLDMGFLPDIRRIIDLLPEKKQTLLFSATMPREIKQLADKLLDNPAQITVAAESPAVERIEQTVYHVAKADKPALLKRLVDTMQITRAIVFTRTKYGADRVAKHINQSGGNAEAIHGDKNQNARQRALDRFRAGRVEILVATDIAARGIDVDGISHVINYDIARDAECHVHRIGRTARAGADGAAISFCDREEVPHLRAVERLLRMEIEVIGEKPAYLARGNSSRAKHPLDRQHAGKGNRYKSGGHKSGGGGGGSYGSGGGGGGGGKGQGQGGRGGARPGGKARSGASAGKRSRRP